jgi:hypothetical protein
VDHAAAEAGRSAVHYSGLTWIWLDFFGYLILGSIFPTGRSSVPKLDQPAGRCLKRRLPSGRHFPAGGNSPDDYQHEF